MSTFWSFWEIRRKMFARTSVCISWTYRRYRALKSGEISFSLPLMGNNSCHMDLTRSFTEGNLLQDSGVISRGIPRDFPFGHNWRCMTRWTSFNDADNRNTHFGGCFSASSGWRRELWSLYFSWEQQAFVQPMLLPYGYSTEVWGINSISFGPVSKHQVKVIFSQMRMLVIPVIWTGHPLHIVI